MITQLRPDDTQKRVEASISECLAGTELLKHQKLSFGSLSCFSARWKFKALWGKEQDNPFFLQKPFLSPQASTICNYSVVMPALILLQPRCAPSHQVPREAWDMWAPSTWGEESAQSLPDMQTPFWLTHILKPGPHWTHCNLELGTLSRPPCHWWCVWRLTWHVLWS